MANSLLFCLRLRFGFFRAPLLNTLNNILFLDGTIIWIPLLTRVPGTPSKKRYSCKPTRSLAIDGLRYQKLYLAGKYTNLIYYFQLYNIFAYLSEYLHDLFSEKILPLLYKHFTYSLIKFRTDNQVKNHFYSSIRCLIQNISNGAIYKECRKYTRKVII